MNQRRLRLLYTLLGIGILLVCTSLVLNLAEGKLERTGPLSFKGYASLSHPYGGT